MFIPELSMKPFTPHSAVVVKCEMRLNEAYAARIKTGRANQSFRPQCPAGADGP